MTIVMTDYDRTLERAKRLASVAHQGQKDSGGAPYINHPMRVATYVQITSAWCGLSAEEQQVATIAAWLHDVIEDTRHKAVSITADSLLSRGFAQEVVEVVVLLTRVKGVPDEVYYQRIL
jgi:(p)ppGpp synthase/HD superfamily hydrolase